MLGTDQIVVNNANNFINFTKEIRSDNVRCSNVELSNIKPFGGGVNTNDTI